MGLENISVDMKIGQRILMNLIMAFAVLIYMVTGFQAVKEDI